MKLVAIIVSALVAVAMGNPASIIFLSPSSSIFAGSKNAFFYAVSSTSTRTVTRTVTSTSTVLPTCLIIPANLAPCPRAQARSLDYIQPSDVQQVETTAMPSSFQDPEQQVLQSSQLEAGEFQIHGLSDTSQCLAELQNQKRDGERILLTIVSFTTRTFTTTTTVTSTLPLGIGASVAINVAVCVPNLNLPPCPVVVGK